MSKKTNQENPDVILFPIDKVIVDREVRQRTNAIGGVEFLAEDMVENGQLHPITIREDGSLVIGERRLNAAKHAGWTHIRAQIRKGLTPVDSYRLELAENLKRRNLPWQDEVRAIGIYHDMKVQTIGPMWTVLGTANDLKRSETNIRRWLEVYKFIGDEEVMQAQTLDGAFNLIRGRAERATAAARSRGLEIAHSLPTISSAASAEEKGAAISALLKGNLDEPRSQEEAGDADFRLLEAGRMATEALATNAAVEQITANSPIITADFLEWIETYDGQPFDVLHVDFPYGKNYQGSNTRRTGRAHVAPAYADDPDVYWELLEAFITWQDKIAYPIAHLIFWFDMEHYAATKDTLTNAGWKLIQPHPLIWHKPYQGVAADTKRRPRHTYETALFLSRGDRKLVKLEQDVFVGRVDEKLHINQKSEEMLRQFLTLVVDEHTAIIDPTCGSGTALAAARTLGAQRIVGVEMDEENAAVARHILARGDVK